MAKIYRHTCITKYASRKKKIIWFHPYTDLCKHCALFPSPVKKSRYTCKLKSRHLLLRLDSNPNFCHSRAGPNFMALLYRKHRIGAYKSREFCAYGKRISRFSGEFWLKTARAYFTLLGILRLQG